MSFDGFKWKFSPRVLVNINFCINLLITSTVVFWRLSWAFSYEIDMKFRNNFRYKPVLRSCVEGNVFENMETGFPVFFRSQKSMTISWNTKKSKIEMPWNFLTVNINLHFRRWRLKLRPFDGWLSTTLRPLQKRTDLKVSLHASHSKQFSGAPNEDIVQNHLT